MGSSTTEHQTQNTNTHQVQNLTTTPTNPGYVDNALSGLVGNVSNLANSDPHSFIAGPDPLQTQAGDNASRLSGTPWAYDGATDVTRGIANQNSPSILGHMNEFMNPYTSMVVKGALQGFDQNSAQVNAQNLLNRGQDTTFGGSGAAITDALTRGQQSLARGQLQGGLLSQGYNTSLAGATAQAGLDQQNNAQRLAAAGQLGNIANDYQSNQRANIGAQGTIGSILQGLTQAQTGAPVSMAGTTAGILGSLPLGLEHGQNSNGVSDGTGTSTGTSTTTQSDPMQTLGSLAMLAAAPFTGGATLMGGLGGLAGAFQGGGASGGFGAGLGNLFHNDPTGMWSLGSAGG